MFGLGIAKGLGITLKNFINTFIDDLKYFPSSALNEEAFARRQGPEGAGLFTVEYPEQKLKTPENFRFLPFLLTDYEVPKDAPDFDREQWAEQNRCTSCGICAKVCPPQCIWIVRTNDPDTGKPIPQPAEFYIDTDICMNCGYCAEYCPFDAIKMDHDYELADYEREQGHVHDLERLLRPVSYYASIRPTWNALEEKARREAEEEKRRKAEEKKRKAAEKAAAKAAKAKKEAATVKSDGGDGKAAAKPTKRSPEEIKAQREAMLAKKAANKGDKGEGKPKKRSPEEVKAQREAMMAKKAARAKQAEAAGPGDGGDESQGKAADSKPKKRTPEEIQAQREAMLAKKAARAGAAQSAPAKDTLSTKEAKAKTAELAHESPVPTEDLTKIEGIGPKIKLILVAADITTFAQLAKTDVARLKEILNEAGSRYRMADPSTWPEQAQLAADGKWEELQKLQDVLDGGRRPEK